MVTHSVLIMIFILQSTFISSIPSVNNWIWYLYRQTKYLKLRKIKYFAYKGEKYPEAMTQPVGLALAISEVFGAWQFCVDQKL